MVALICIMIAVSYYYALYYPTTDAVSLPKTSISGLIINIFNGYSEKVSPGESYAATLSAMQNSIVITAAGMMIALGLMIVFLYQRKGVDLNGKWRMLGAFFGSLLISQYTVGAYLLWKRGYYATGISFFTVDSIVIVVLFCLINVVLNYLTLLKEPNFKKRLEGFLLWALFALFIIGFVFIFFSSLLLQNLGYSQYNPAFAGTYVLHGLGLIEFIFLFFYFWFDPFRIFRKKRSSSP